MLKDIPSGRGQPWSFPWRKGGTQWSF
jgi:hypothetical protein